MPLPTDPLLASQWHLINAAVGGLDLNVEQVWSPNFGPAYTGAGVIVAVAGDGFEYSHPDLVANYLSVSDFDFLDNDVDPFGLTTDILGTPLMGLIGAVDNSVGGVGVAFNASLIGYRTLVTPSAGLIGSWVDHVESSLGAASTSASILNFTYGLANVTTAQFHLMANAGHQAQLTAAINEAVDSGRGGDGLIIVQSSGTTGDDANAFGMTNDTRIITVGAVDFDGFAWGLSGHGSSILVSAFAGDDTHALVTTDRTTGGFSTGAFTTTNFDPEQAAAAMVAGVTALMLEANGSLGWRDVQDILAYSAHHTGTDVGPSIVGTRSAFENGPWMFTGATNWNGGGLHYSIDYGFGLVDALSAVRLSETWFKGVGSLAAQTSANEQVITQDMLASQVVLNGDLSTLAHSFTQDMTIDRVAVTLDFQTTFLSDVEVFLIAPDGTKIAMIRDSGAGNDFDGVWTVEAQGFRGMSTQGEWQLEIVDDTPLDPTTFRDVDLTFYGSTDVNDRYIFTDEYSDYGAYNRVTAVVDTDGGIDVANASAITSNLRLYLDGQISLIDAMRTTLSGIENAIGGDGNDSIQGNAGANQIWGERGRDVLSGHNGQDMLDGGAENDILNGGDGNDNLFGGDGNDSIFGESNVTVVVTTSDDFIDGGAGNDFLYGQAGNDFFVSGTGNDFFSGGNGTMDVVSYADETGPVSAGLGVLYFAAGGALGDTFDQIEGLEGTNFDDRLWGGAGANKLSGLYGNDTLIGLEGNDTLNGDAGNDTFQFTGVGTTLGFDQVNGGANTDTLEFTYLTTFAFVDLAYALPSGIEAWTNTGTTWVALANATSVENVIGTAFGDELIGDVVANRLDGLAGNDKLMGRGGNDTLIGQEGNDTFLFTGVATTLGLDQVDGGGDTDTLDFTGLTTYAWVDLEYALPSGIEAWTQNGPTWIGLADVSQVENITGTALGDELTGSIAANTLTGAAGNDIFNGRGGNDTLNGDAGNDTFKYTGVGNTLGFDQVDGGANSDTLDFTGLATFAYVDFTRTGATDADAWTQEGTTWFMLASTVDVENAIGTAFSDEFRGDGVANSFTGAAGNDTFNGRGGNDTLNGDAGNDSFKFTDVGTTLGVDQVNGGANTDTLDFTGLTTFAFVDFAYTGATGIEAWTQTGATWVALANVTQVENAIGTAFADQLTGDGQANTFNGAAGADIFNGRAGADVFTGGADADTFKFAAGDSGQTAATLDTITDYAKGAVGTGDKFDFTAVLAIGGSNAAATATQASISTTTGVASFLAGQGTTIADALSDIAARMTDATDAAGEFAFFQVNNTGNMHLFISDGVAGVGANDVVVQLNTITTIGSINITAGDVTILA